MPKHATEAAAVGTPAAFQTAAAGWIGIRYGVMLALVGMIVFWALTAVSLTIPGELLKDRIRDGIETGAIHLAESRPKRNSRVGEDQWTDCVVYQMIIPSKNPFLDIVSPRRLNTENSTCLSLKRFVGAGNIGTYRYHRYIHGATTIGRYAIALLSVEGYRKVLSWGNLMLLLATLGAALYRTLKARIAGDWHTLPAMAALVVLTAVLAFHMGLEIFAMSPNRGLVSALILIAISMFVVLRGERWSLRRFGLFAALFGVVSSWIAFMNGMLPLGLAVILGLAGFAILYKTASGREPIAVITLKTMAVAVGAYCAAFATSFALKLILAIIVFRDDIISDFMTRLLNRVVGGDYTLKEWVWALNSGFENVGWGSSAFGISAFLVFGALGAIGATAYSVFGRERNLIWPVGALLTSAAIPLLWLFVFRNHSVEHAFFMIRIISWPMALGAAMFTLWAVEVFGKRRSAPI